MRVLLEELQEKPGVTAAREGSRDGGGGGGRKKKKERDIFCVISHAWLTSLTPHCISQLCAAADVEAAEA